MKYIGSLEGGSKKFVKNLERKLKIFRALDVKEPQMVNIHHIIDTALDILDEGLASDVEVKRLYDPTMQKIWAPPGPVNHLFINILLNAIQAIEAEGEGTKGTITIYTDSCPDEVVVKIFDTGEGIPEANMSKIFLPFYTTRPHDNASGLGLAVCHQVITDMDGEIKVKSKVGEGTEFEVVFPTGIRNRTNVS